MPASRFVTLTRRPNPSVPLASEIDALNRDWRTLYKRIRRRYPHQVHGYVKVIELTKAGAPHLHILLDSSFIPQRWLSAQWHEISGNRVVDIRHIGSSRELSRYVSKYLAKGLPADSPRRRWSQSPGFLPPDPGPELAEGEVPLEWHYHSASLRDLHAYLIALGAHHIDPYYVLGAEAGAVLFGRGSLPP